MDTYGPILVAVLFILFIYYSSIPKKNTLDGILETIKNNFKPEGKYIGLYDLDDKVGFVIGENQYFFIFEPVLVTYRNSILFFDSKRNPKNRIYKLAPYRDPVWIYKKQIKEILFLTFETHWMFIIINKKNVTAFTNFIYYEENRLDQIKFIFEDFNTMGINTREIEQSYLINGDYKFGQDFLNYVLEPEDED